MPAAIGFSTFLGDYFAQTNAVAVDGAGNSYVTGHTSAFVPTLNAMQPHDAGGQDAFVAKFDPSGALVYSTYLGGKGTDDGMGIAVDGGGNAYVAGQTTSTDFPTLNALQATNHGSFDFFVTKLDPSGAMLYSTYLGGSASEASYVGRFPGRRIAADDSGNVYVSGRTISTDFPTTPDAIEPDASTGHVFLTKLDTTQSGANSLVYSTYLTSMAGMGLVVDGSGGLSGRQHRHREGEPSRLRHRVRRFPSRRDDLGSGRGLGRGRVPDRLRHQRFAHDRQRLSAHAGQWPRTLCDRTRPLRRERTVLQLPRPQYGQRVRPEHRPGRRRPRIHHGIRQPRAADEGRFPGTPGRI